MVDETNQIPNPADSQPAGEGGSPEPPATPDPIAELNAKVSDLAAKNEMYARQLSERDQALRRQAEDLKQFKAKSVQALDHVARTAYGVEATEPTPYDQFRKMVEDTPDTPPAAAAGQTGQDNGLEDQLADVYIEAGINPFEMPKELVGTANLVVYQVKRGQVDKAIQTAKASIQKYQESHKAGTQVATPAPAAPQTPAVPRDRTAPVGGAGGTVSRVWRDSEVAAMSADQYMKVREDIIRAKQEGRYELDT